MKRTLLALGTSAALVAAGLTPAVADTTSATSYAAAAEVTAGTGITPQESTSGDISGLLDVVDPVLNQFVTPLSSSLSSLPSDTVTDLVTGLGSSLVANSASGSVTAPSTFPDCTAAPWNAGNCYSAASLGDDNAPTVSLDAGALQGWSAADGSSGSAGATTTGATLSALGIALGSLGTVQSSTSCPAGAACTTSGSVSGASLLGGQVQVRSASDGSLQVALAGGAFAPVSSLSGSTAVQDGTTAASVSAVGSSLQVSVAMTLDQLLNALGMSDTLSELNAADDNSRIALDLVLAGPGASGTAPHTAGLTVGLGLQAHIAISVEGLVDVLLDVGDSSTGDIAGLQLAYTAATQPTGSTGTTTGQQAVK